MRLAATIFALTLVSALAWPGSGAARPLAHSSHESGARVIGYWTPDRMREAVPADRGAKAQPNAKPGGGGGGSRPGSATSAEVPLPYPSAHGKVFFTDNG